MIVEAINRLRAGTTDGTGNTQMREVVGNKTDAAVTAVGTTKSLMGYVKGLIGEMSKRSVPHAWTYNVDDPDEYVVAMDEYGEGVLTGITLTLPLTQSPSTGIPMGVHVSLDGLSFFSYEISVPANTPIGAITIPFSFNHAFNFQITVAHRCTNFDMGTTILFTMNA